MTRGLVAVSVGAAGLFSAMAAWAQPGRTKTQTRSTARSTSGTFTPTPPAENPQLGTPPPRSGDDDGDDGGAGNVNGNGGAVLAPPATAPDPGYVYTPPAPIPTYQYSPPPVVSGAT